MITHYTAEQYMTETDLHFLFDHAEELVDGRFAVVNQVLYEVIEHKQCDDGKDYAVLIVRNAEDVFGPESLQCEPDLNLSMIEVYVADDVREVHAKMLELMSARLAVY